MRKGGHSEFVPTEWLEEYCRRSAPDLFKESRCLDLVLSYIPKKDNYDDYDDYDDNDRHHAAANDLSQGFIVTRRHSPNHPTPLYVIYGKDYEVGLSQVTGKNNGCRMAKVCFLRKTSNICPIELLIRGKISFKPRWDEPYCDLEWLWFEWERHLERSKRQAKQLRELKRRALKELGTSLIPDGLLRVQHLHAEVRRRYGSLKKTMQLLRSRSQIESAAELTGCIISVLENTGETNSATDNTDQRLETTIVIEESIGTIEKDDKVLILANESKHPMRARIAWRTTKQIGIISQTELGLSLDDKVRIQKITRFSMRNNAESLDRLLAGNVAGSWNDLVTMLCTPNELEVVVPSSPAFYYSDRDHEEDPKGSKPLNKEQRCAVDGALSTPHAFFIQGPPGTGKTTVITELVRQLVARKERVLLLAPTHVAVDEVLSRISRRPGDVRPVRLAWDDSRISREEVRCYSESHIKEELRCHVRTPANAQSPEWERERSEALRDCNAIDQWQETQEVAKAARSELTNAKAEQERLSLESTQDISDQKEQLFLHVRERNAAKTSAAAKAKKAEKKSLIFEANRETAHIGLRILALAGKGMLSKLEAEMDKSKKKYKAATRKKNSTQKKVLEIRISLKASQAKWQRILSAQEQAVSQCKEVVNIALEARGTAKQVVRNVVKANTKGALLERRNKLGSRIEWLTGRIELEEKWFEISGQAASSPANSSVYERIGGQLAKLINLFCSTTTGIAGACRSGSPFLDKDSVFDTLIVDEASRVTDSEFLIGAVRARRWILVGDEHQLPPYVEQDDEYHLHALVGLHAHEKSSGELEDQVKRLSQMWREDEELHQFREKSVLSAAQGLLTSGNWEKTYREEVADAMSYFDRVGDDAEKQCLETMRLYFVRSLLERCVSSPAGVPAGLKQALIVQRRMIPSIAELVKGPIYDNQYISPSLKDLATCGVTPLILKAFNAPIVFLDTSKHRQACEETIRKHGFENELEAQWICDVCRYLEKCLVRRRENATVSILTFYRAQKYLIEEKLYRGPGFKAVKFEVIDAIDKIQGQESDVVFISFCRAQPRRRSFSTSFGRWLKDYRRLNVATTRAHRSLIMVGHSPLLRNLSFTEEEAKAKAFYANLGKQFGWEKGVAANNDMVMVHNYETSRSRY